MQRPETFYHSPTAPRHLLILLTITLGVFYETTEAFREAYYSEGFEKLPANIAGDWSGTDRQGEASPMDGMPPPQGVKPGPARYSVDQEAKYVKRISEGSLRAPFVRDIANKVC